MTPTEKMGRKEIKLRLGKALRANLKDAAKASSKTLNGEISARLEDSLQADILHELELILTNMRLLLLR